MARFYSSPEPQKNPTNHPKSGYSSVHPQRGQDSSIFASLRVSISDRSRIRRPQARYLCMNMHLMRVHICESSSSTTQHSRVFCRAAC